MCFIFEKNFIISKDISFKDIIERRIFNVVGRIYVFGWVDNIVKMVIILNYFIN